ncbi:chloramphenicol acetyltransferase [Niastella vici]|uniref:Chloramphenicol acetyltransferase n=1 Tax=Niastella vici TaxID=1703345 RepID=A0A1V9FYI8_9BACT|nr:chloramphenicol acetyltransferase [Niastella vici]OQP63390.1 chloramphenicol acetyltransferase [Niastella vici]
MKTAIDITSWARKDHYQFFSQFEEPFHGITVEIDCTTGYDYARQHNISFFQYYLYQALKAANTIENFRYRIVNKDVFLFNRIDASPTIPRPDGTFGFAYIDYTENEDSFYANATEIIEAEKGATGLKPAVSGENVIHFSAIPWLNFTAISHARCFSFADSCPKITFGKVKAEHGKKTMPVAVHVHHALADGYHVGLFINKFQELMNRE